MAASKSHVLALAESLLVTFLWSTSYILIKVELEEVNPLAFAAYRYAIASAVLMLVASWRYRKPLKNLALRHILGYSALGFTGYLLAQGLQFVGLFYLQPVTVTFILNLTPVFVLILSAMFLKEKPSYGQLVGISLALCGVPVFFYESLLASEEVTGILSTLVSGVGWAIYMVISRYYLRESRKNVVVLTVCSMMWGSLMLFGATTLTGNLTAVSSHGWVIILWLSVANTALAFALWNHALRTLRVYEQSILQNTMLIQIAFLSHVFLHEGLVLRQVFGIALVFVGVLIVQLRPR